MSFNLQLFSSSHFSLSTCHNNKHFIYWLSCFLSIYLSWSWNQWGQGHVCFIHCAIPNLLSEYSETCGFNIFWVNVRKFIPKLNFKIPYFWTYRQFLYVYIWHIFYIFIKAFKNQQEKMFNMINVINTAVCYTWKLLRVNHKHSHHKAKKFFFDFFNVVSV